MCHATTTCLRGDGPGRQWLLRVTPGRVSFPLELALRYLRSKKRTFVSVGTAFAVLGVALGVAALATVMSVTGGFRAQFREKVVGVNAHLLVLKRTADFREYRDVMEQMRGVPGVIGVAPFTINPMMVTHGDRTAAGVLLKGIDPQHVGEVLDLPRHIVEGSLEGLRAPGAKPAERRRNKTLDDDSRGVDKDHAARPSASGAARSVPAGSASPAEPASVEEGRKSLLRAIREAELEPKPLPSGTADAEEPVLELPEGAPVGEIEPEGGFAGELPEDDELPPELDPDPCRDPEAVKKLPGIAVGTSLRQMLGVKLGDCVQVTSPTIGYTLVRGVIRAPVARQFRVIAVFDAGFDQYDSKLVYTDLWEAQAFADAGDSVTGVEMKVEDLEQAALIGAEVERRLNDGIYNVIDWEKLNHNLFTALRIQQILMSLVLALIIVVASFTVIATLIMVVLDKKREIATLKAMGASDQDLMLAFLLQGGIIGVVGAAVGIGLGYAVCRWIITHGIPLDPKVYFISALPVRIRGGEFAFTGVFAVLVCLIATVWPALYAARLRPAEAFREQ